MEKAYKYRIYPTEDQKTLINKTLYATEAYNMAVEIKEFVISRLSAD
ncbi:MAG: hypothetical protein C4554_05210 [Dethiobacter sp.]|jgi:hypothetical protein|nr:MAG: hypothetical protein C4554_05210 [Dethiobacter sp.]